MALLPLCSLLLEKNQSRAVVLEGETPGVGLGGEYTCLWFSLYLTQKIPSTPEFKSSCLLEERLRICTGLSPKSHQVLKNVILWKRCVVSNGGVDRCDQGWA
jgi:hypothetical protein